MLHTTKESYASQNTLTARIYKEHQSWLTNWLKIKLKCPYAAEDVSHDTFIRMLTSTKIEDINTPRAYLLVIANRLLINRFRRQKVEKEVLQQVSIFFEQHENRSPSEITAARDLLSQVVDLLSNELGEKSRLAFEMSRLEGASYKEIAVQLDVSESSVKQYLAKAMVYCHSRLYDN